MHRVAVISAILETPEPVQAEFNRVLASARPMIRGRLGIPFPEGIAAISIVVCATVDDINRLTGRLGQIPHVQVKATISKQHVPERMESHDPNAYRSGPDPNDPRSSEPGDLL